MVAGENPARSFAFVPRAEFVSVPRCDWWWRLTRSHDRCVPAVAVSFVRGAGRVSAGTPVRGTVWGGLLSRPLTGAAAWVDPEVLPGPAILPLCCPCAVRPGVAAQTYIARAVGSEICAAGWVVGGASGVVREPPATDSAVHHSCVGRPRVIPGRPTWEIHGSSVWWEPVGLGGLGFIPGPGLSEGTVGLTGINGAQIQAQRATHFLLLRLDGGVVGFSDKAERPSTTLVSEVVEPPLPHHASCKKERSGRCC